MINDLSKAFLSDNKDEIEQAKDELGSKVKLDFEHIKNSLQVKIHHYIQSRGSITVQGHFDPGWITTIFRNKALTDQKVEKMRQLAEQIKNAADYQSIKTLIADSSKDSEAVQSRFKSGVQTTLKQLLDIVEHVSPEAGAQAPSH